MTERQVALYQKQVDLLAAALKENQEGVARKGLILSSLGKFKQICNHPCQYLGTNAYTPELSGKFQRLGELARDIAAAGEKVLVFTQFRELTDILAHYLSEIFDSEGLFLHGSVPAGERQRMVEAFQRERGLPFFVLSIKAGGTGLNLTAANHVIHFDRWWNPAVENQATDRAFRIGQKKTVLVHKLICRGTIEDRIDAMIADKQALADNLIEGQKGVHLSEMSDEQLMSLVSLERAGPE